MRETWGRSLGQEDPLEKENKPTPVFLPGESHGWRSLVGYISQWGHKELETTDFTSLHFNDNIVEWVPKTNCCQQLQEEF